MIKLTTQEDGQEFYLNPVYIAVLKQMQDYSRIELSIGPAAVCRVLEPVEAILSAMANARA